MTLLKLRASVSDTAGAGPLLGSFHMVRSAFSTTLWQCAFTRHFRFFQIVLPPCFQRMMAADRVGNKSLKPRDHGFGMRPLPPHYSLSGAYFKKGSYVVAPCTMQK
jgi:hypothetical protein